MGRSVVQLFSFLSFPVSLVSHNFVHVLNSLICSNEFATVTSHVAIIGSVADVFFSFSKSVNDVNVRAKYRDNSNCQGLQFVIELDLLAIHTAPMAC